MAVKIDPRKEKKHKEAKGKELDLTEESDTPEVRLLAWGVDREGSTARKILTNLGAETYHPTDDDLKVLKGDSFTQAEWLLDCTMIMPEVLRSMNDVQERKTNGFLGWMKTITH